MLQVASAQRATNVHTWPGMFSSSTHGHMVICFWAMGKQWANIQHSIIRGFTSSQSWQAGVVRRRRCACVCVCVCEWAVQLVCGYVP